MRLSAEKKPWTIIASKALFHRVITRKRLFYTYHNYRIIIARPDLQGSCIQDVDMGDGNGCALSAVSVVEQQAEKFSTRYVIIVISLFGRCHDYGEKNVSIF